MRSGSDLYQLIILLSKPKTIGVGKLGLFSFPAGYYVYTGSAKNELNARIARHIRGRKKMHWHIDFLLRYGRIVKVNRYQNTNLYECNLNQRTENKHGSKIIAPRFGSSDCNCRSHLIYFEKPRHFSSKCYFDDYAPESRGLVRLY